MALLDNTIAEYKIEIGELVGTDKVKLKLLSFWN